MKASVNTGSSTQVNGPNKSLSEGRITGIKLDVCTDISLPGNPNSQL